MDKDFAWIGAIVAAVIGLAIVSVIVGKNAQTAGVIQAGGSALSSVIGAAVAPVS
jgi:PRD1 phage membrane DNA delivery